MNLILEGGPFDGKILPNHPILQNPKLFIEFKKSGELYCFSAVLNGRRDDGKYVRVGLIYSHVKDAQCKTLPKSS